jgi:hypothetical protein
MTDNPDSLKNPKKNEYLTNNEMDELERLGKAIRADLDCIISDGHICFVCRMTAIKNMKKYLHIHHQHKDNCRRRR